MNARLPCLALLSVPLLAGCAASGPFPSLSPRPAEQLSMDEPVRVAPVVAEDPQLRALVAGLAADARSGQAAFVAALGAARSRVGAAGGSGSDSWIEAQQAISRIEAARAATVGALAELDALSIARANVPTNRDDFSALMAAVESAAALARDQQAEIDRLRGSLSPA